MGDSVDKRALELLLQLSELLEKGYLSREEFDEQKAVLLASSRPPVSVMSESQDATEPPDSQIPDAPPDKAIALTDAVSGSSQHAPDDADTTRSTRQEELYVDKFVNGSRSQKKRVLFFSALIAVASCVVVLLVSLPSSDPTQSEPYKRLVEIKGELQKQVADIQSQISDQTKANLRLEVEQKDELETLENQREELIEERDDWSSRARNNLNALTQIDLID